MGTFEETHVLPLFQAIKRVGDDPSKCSPTLPDGVDHFTRYVPPHAGVFFLYEFLISRHYREVGRISSAVKELGRRGRFGQVARSDNIVNELNDHINGLSRLVASLTVSVLPRGMARKSGLD